MELLGLGKKEIKDQASLDKESFVKQWVVSGRMHKLYDKIRNDVDIPLPKYAFA
jgi:hypothetical protein